ncbi:MAG: hypothetical protein KF846_13690 [Cyclobacteriaceae bacterium]|nr:hypothetical protein [Cyclobacteriaceae bacterium]MBX2957210.1 hypothetical protein [Cyclobacteriaceae bacterium]
MDPNLFHIDYGRLIELVTALSLTAIFIERALAPLFESRWFIDRTEAREYIPAHSLVNTKTTVPEQSERPKRKGIREFIAVVVSFAVCYFWDIDAMSIMLQSKETVTLPGMLLTAGIISGGAKGSNVLFQNVLDIMSSAERERKGK